MALVNKHMDILISNETKKLSTKISSEEIAIGGYTVFRHDRSSKGGGVMYYVYRKIFTAPVSIILKVTMLMD